MAKFEDGLPYFPFGSRNLFLTSPFLRGTDVKVFQFLFNQTVKHTNPPLGPIGPTIAVDGIFGPQTNRAVINYQAYFSLTVDGIIGPETFFTLGQAIGRHTTYGGPAFGSRTLSVGASGGDVTVLQNRLNTFRYASLLGHPATGLFGGRTRRAVKAFQKDINSEFRAGLAVDGVVGPFTLNALWLYTYAGGRDLFLGRQGTDTAFVQTLLRKMGFYRGAIDGYFGSVTRQAVLDFQKEEKIKQDGVVGPVTFYHLGLNNRNPAPKPWFVA